MVRLPHFDDVSRVQFNEIITANIRGNLDGTNLPDGTAVVNGKVVLPPTGVAEGLAYAGAGLGRFGIFVLSGLGGALLFNAARDLLVLPVNSTPLYLWAMAGLGLFACGAAFRIAREKRYGRFLAAIQIAIAVVAGIIAFFAEQDAISKLVVFSAAVVTVADGLEKMHHTSVHQKRG